MKNLMPILFLLLVVTFISGCGKEEEILKLKDLEYTVVGEKEIPRELLEVLENKKQEPFKMTYQDGEGLYLCKGYGEKPTGGYCIKVTDFYLTKNAIFFKTTLEGPVKEEQIETGKSFPYIVIKTEHNDKTIVFN